MHTITNRNFIIIIGSALIVSLMKCFHFFNRKVTPDLPFLFFFLIIRRPPRSTLFPSPTLFRSPQHPSHVVRERARLDRGRPLEVGSRHLVQLDGERKRRHAVEGTGDAVDGIVRRPRQGDRKSTRLNSSHSQISYAAFCLKKKYLRATHAPLIGIAFYLPQYQRIPNNHAC